MLIPSISETAVDGVTDVIEVSGIGIVYMAVKGAEATSSTL